MPGALHLHGTAHLPAGGQRERGGLVDYRVVLNFGLRYGEEAIFFLLPGLPPGSGSGSGRGEFS